ncbi:alpha-2-macroglobulin [Cruoricaptor ignavus]|uniref:alpha-2-macroglobulin family protein n=1 Tax=Cruoricaptor ignavus TaxID=1118202 RepID=UPI00370D811D
MNKYLLIFILFFGIMPVFGQNFYEQRWKKIESNYREGRYKSNLPLILEVQEKALKEGNSAELIRSLRSEFSIVNNTSDDKKNDAASQFFAKLSTMEKQLKNQDRLLYKVMLGSFFHEYYQENKWKINQRTSVDNQDVTQIETWTKMDFKNHLLKSFNELEAEKPQLQKVSLKPYQKIFQDDFDLEFTPTLADWVAIQQIEFLDDDQLFTANEIKANQQKINEIYDERIAENSGNAKLRFQHLQLKFNCEKQKCKDEIAQLEWLYNSGGKNDYKIFIAENIANLYRRKGENIKALEILENAKNSFKNSKYINIIVNKENDIKQSTLTLDYELVTKSDKPIHLVAEHKNLEKFTLNIFQVADAESFKNHLFHNYKFPISSVKKKLYTTENFTLPSKKDYKSYKTSLEIPALPSGIYIAEYQIDKEKEQFYFIASEYRIIEIAPSVNQHSKIYQLVNRENGKPVPNIPVEIFRDVKTGKVSTITDEQGRFSFASENYYGFEGFVKFRGNNFELYNFSSHKFYSGNYPNSLTQIFLDRAIYRPGQTVYFKVINTKLNGEKETVNAGVSQSVSLLDANREILQTKEFTANEFGSYSGNFVLPHGKLNGYFSIKIGNEYKSFRVEEYKRPKFEVAFEPLKNEYKYGETIELKGNAASFSGVPLSNIAVNFEIKKRNMRWRYFPWFEPREDNENSILGETKTNERGEFTIKIDLKKDESLEGIQVDNFEILADVTDINGETQSATKTITVASVSHYISAENLGKIFSGEDAKIKVETKNYSGENLQKPYQIRLEKLREPQQIFRENFRSEIQDLPKMSREEFVRKFPNDRFSKEDLTENWPTEKLILNKTQQPSGNAEISLGELEAGTYRLEFFNVEGNDTIRTTQYFTVWDKAGKNFPRTMLEVLPEKKSFDRGEKARIFVYSSVLDAQLKIFLQNGDGNVKPHEIAMKNGLYEYAVEIPRDEKIKSLQLDFQIIAFNDFQTKTLTLPINQEDKSLKIETVTFRDKIEPNSKEKWTVKISGQNSEKINAEVLATMYDKSLDNFSPNYFNWRKLYRDTARFYSYGNSWQKLEKSYWRKNFKYLETYRISEPKFRWFNEGLEYGNAVAYSANVMYQAAPAPMSVGKNRTAKTMAYAESARDLAETKKTDFAEKPADLEKVKVRQNLQETAFFYPNLLTDQDGNVHFEFTSPEALTKWKLMFLAHTKDARAATLEKDVVTQKEFSVTPNFPRFLRENDEIQIQARISNLSAKALSGSAQLQVLDAFTNENITEKFGQNLVQNFSVNAAENSVANWILKVPYGVESVVLKVVAKAGNFSDGEQNAVAILPNRMLITDAQPIFVKQGETKTFTLKNLAENQSATASNYANTLELTTNPIWEVILALPSLKEDANISADVQFNKWFADVLASKIFKQNPRLQKVFEEYQSKDLLKSNLEKNQELKQLLLEETPWVFRSKHEAQQMQDLARLFDANTMRQSIKTDWDDLMKWQNSDGGFSWVRNSPSSYYVSVYILKNLGRIYEWLGGNLAEYQAGSQRKMVEKLVKYVENEALRYYDLEKKNVWNNFVLDYLDARHYWEKEFPLKGKGAQLKALIIQKAPKAEIRDFTFYGLHRAALLFDFYGLKTQSDKLMTYLKETSAETQTQGVYWKENLNSWGWYSSKIVNHSGALEVFQKLRPKDENFIEELKIWLITQKEVSSWDTSRSTAEVIFTIVNSGKSWTSAESDNATIIWGGKPLANPDTKATGYIKTTVKPEIIDKSLAEVTVTKAVAGIMQGGVFWQYYEDLEKVKSSENYISITKEIYRKINTENGEQLQKISEQTPLKIGDRVSVRMVLNTDRNLEFVHLKDMRAAGFEPVDALSGYQWKNSLGYYQSTKDASTNFYIQYMPKGRYVFEYELVCNAAGSFSNGFSTLQNYYAPQMNARSKGERIFISDN